MDGKETPRGPLSVCKVDVRALRGKRPMDRERPKNLGNARPVITPREKIHMKNGGII